MTSTSISVVIFYIPNHSTFFTFFGVVAKIRTDVMVEAVLVDKFLRAPITMFEVVIQRVAWVVGTDSGAIGASCCTCSRMILWFVVNHFTGKAIWLTE
ncbi:unnamed protein product [Meloidogyne enterolobii]|uniref:Uncharacterized protein n=1 Tax=Meloidogyne enterolobii TaxID=390850 RepID=A0ACB1AAD4_MELEN